jgi:hypothetical protein
MNKINRNKQQIVNENKPNIEQRPLHPAHLYREEYDIEGQIMNKYTRNKQPKISSFFRCI